jgi:hypothetical protein
MLPSMDILGTMAIYLKKKDFVCPKVPLENYLLMTGISTSFLVLLLVVK